MKSLKSRRMSIERLESREVMSASPLTTLAAIHPATPAAALAAPAAATSASLQTRFTAIDLRNAYGVSGITIGSTPADGRGQTVAIIDEGVDPDLSAEITAFDNYCGLPAAKLTVVPEVMSNGAAPAACTQLWHIETSLDVEMCHAFAPGANIIVYEANQQDPVGLYQCVDWARNNPAVSVVSMSFAANNEMSHEGSIDGLFTTPAGHQGVTFLAGAGDNAVPAYPATSPNVLSVGGTKLTMYGGNYYSETVWNDGYVSSSTYQATGGGYSRIESEPSYQSAFQSTGRRGAVDVAMNAEPNTLICTTAVSGDWMYEGGTSAATPEMAAIIAIADQGRVANGRGTFYGVNSAIYALPSADFHDITAGNNGYYSAGRGWDPVSGRGSPVGFPFIRDLVNSGNYYTPQYGVSNFVGISALRQYSGTYLATVASANGRAAVDAVLGAWQQASTVPNGPDAGTKHSAAAYEAVFADLA
jgi:subtilase family serine protease